MKNAKTLGASIALACLAACGNPSGPSDKDLLEMKGKCAQTAQTVRPPGDGFSPAAAWNYDAEGKRCYGFAIADTSTGRRPGTMLFDVMTAEAIAGSVDTQYFIVREGVPKDVPYEEYATLVRKVIGAGAAPYLK